MAATSLLAATVVCCSIKCRHQRSRNSRAVAAAFGFGVAFGNTTVLSNLGVYSLLIYPNKCIHSFIQGLEARPSHMNLPSITM